MRNTGPGAPHLYLHRPYQVLFCLGSKQGGSQGERKSPPYLSVLRDKNQTNSSQTKCVISSLIPRGQSIGRDRVDQGKPLWALHTVTATLDYELKRAGSCLSHLSPITTAPGPRKRPGPKETQREGFKCPGKQPMLAKAVTSGPFWQQGQQSTKKSEGIAFGPAPPL